MKASLLLTGRTTPDWLMEGCDDYATRIKRYIPFQMRILPDVRNPRNLPVNVLMGKEAETIIASMQPGDFVVLLDERGEQMNTIELAGFLQQRMTGSVRHLVFVIAGAYGAATALQERANHVISLSRLTFPHQLVRLIFLEQLYRALTVLRNEPYHNQ